MLGDTLQATIKGQSRPGPQRLSPLRPPKGQGLEARPG